MILRNILKEIIYGYLRETSREKDKVNKQTPEGIKRPPE